MTKRQCIMIAIISAILTGVLFYSAYYYPNTLAKCLFYLVTGGFCFTCIYLLIAIIWTKGDILPNPYPTIYAFDHDIEEKMKIQDEMRKEKKNG